MKNSQEKIEAIYDLRAAAAKNAIAEKELDENPSASKRDALLDAQIELESKTQRAIEVCHECGHEHEPGAPHVKNEAADVLPFKAKKPS